MKIVEKRVAELIEYANNPRRNEDAAQKVAESIKEFGFINPIAIDENNIVIAGHARLKAAVTLGLETVPCVVHAISEDDARLARIADNKSHEFSTWDTSKLATELEKIRNPLKKLFFDTGSSLKDRKDSLRISFGKVKLDVSEGDSLAFDATFKKYVDDHDSHMGFILHLLGDRYAEN